MQCPWLLGLLISAALATSPSPCHAIDTAFATKNTGDESPACRCFSDGDSAGEVWVGCTGHSMPSVFDSIKELSDDTLLSRLHIWDCHINIIPSDMFAKVKPRTLIMERVELALVRDKAFASIGSGLKHLHLPNNIMRRLDPNMLAGLPRLQSLDLSGNRLVEMRAGDLAAVSELTWLNLADNDLSRIEDGAFIHTPNLRFLSLSRNKLISITNTTFKGLTKLETLELSMNDIRNVDWAAFSEMKELKLLDLGTNHMTGVQLRGLVALQKLILNNNAIQSLKNVSLRDLPSLLMLNMDRNAIMELGENDLFSLSKSTRLTSLSFAANNISFVHPRALAPAAASLTVLAMQNNQLLSLSTESQPWLRPLRRLKTLLLSANGISLLRDGELPPSISLVALDHNNLQQVDAKAFEGLSPSRVYLNNNHLQYLPRDVFQPFSNDSLQAIDISSNDWLCICGQEWLGDWLLRWEDKDISDRRSHGCLTKKSCTPKPATDDEPSSTWVTAAAAILASVSLLVLLAIAWLFVEDGRHRSSSLLSSSPRRKIIDSDLLRLINDREEKTPLQAQPSLLLSSNDKKRVRFHE